MDNLTSYISNDVKTRSDSRYQVRCGSIFFENQGQDYVIIDGHFTLAPGGQFSDGELNGGLIDHSYSIEFVTNPSPPAIDKFGVKSKSRLVIRTIKKKHYAFHK